jgi:hypothetical protein
MDYKSVVWKERAAGWNISALGKWNSENLIVLEAEKFAGVHNGDEFKLNFNGIRRWCMFTDNMTRWSVFTIWVTGVKVDPNVP